MKKPVVLYVEDEESDVALVRHAFRRADLPASMRRVADGQEAIDYLAGQGAFANREDHPIPFLILLDLNLPRLSGFEVLRWVRRQTQYALLPVVVYSSSNLVSDREVARLLGATDYRVKLSDINKLTDLVRQITQGLL